MVEVEHSVHPVPCWVDMNGEDSQSVIVGRLQVHLAKGKGVLPLDTLGDINNHNLLLKLMACSLERSTALSSIVVMVMYANYMYNYST